MEENGNDFLLVRGDIAIVALTAVLNQLRPAMQVNGTAHAQLKDAQSRQPRQAQQTMLDIVAQVTGNTEQTMRECVTLIEQTLNELSHFSSTQGVENTADAAVENVVKVIKESHPYYRDKTGEEICKELGLR